MQLMTMKNKGKSLVISMAMQMRWYDAWRIVW
jgi:hypothetical protein